MATTIMSTANKVNIAMGYSRARCLATLSAFRKATRSSSGSVVVPEACANVPLEGESNTLLHCQHLSLGMAS